MTLNRYKFEFSRNFALLKSFAIVALYKFVYYYYYYYYYYLWGNNG